MFLIWLVLVLGALELLLAQLWLLLKSVLAAKSALTASFSRTNELAEPTTGRTIRPPALTMQYDEIVELLAERDTIIANRAERKALRIAVAENRWREIWRFK